jgi:heme exporter protein CcmD
MLGDLINFSKMGGYGHYIWSAFGLSAVVLIVLAIQSHQFLKSSRKQLHALEERRKKNET